MKGVFSTYWYVSKLNSLADIRAAFHSNATVSARRVLSRTPIKVLNHKPDLKNPEDHFRIVEDQISEMMSQTNLKSKKATQKQHREIQKNEIDNAGFIDYEEGTIKYKKLLEKDDIFSSELQKVTTRKQREKSNKILLEGKRLINDAIAAGVKIEKVFFSGKDNLQGFSFPKDVEIYKVFGRTMKTWSDLTTPPGIMAICKKPSVALNEQSISSLPLTIVCDNIREPGNLGTIMRSAAAAGCKNIITTVGCVDAWDSKVLRAAAGAHFYLPIYSQIRWPYIRNYLPEAFEVFLADTPNRDTQVFQRTKYKKRNTTECRENPKNISEIEVDEDGLIMDPSFDDEHLMRYKDIKLPVVNFPHVSFSHNIEILLVIGGETTGLSLSAYKLASDFDGKIISIPLCNNIDSLNSAAAAAIIAFDIKRQFSKMDH